MNIIQKYITVAAVLLSASAVANDAENEVKAAQERLQATFTEMKIQHFQPSPIEGMFEVFAGKNILYFHPDSETMFVGQIYSKDGVSLTDASRQKYALSVQQDLPMDSGIIIGNPDATKEVIEFGQLDCGYCKKADEWFYDSDMDVKRRYYFIDVGNHPAYPTANKKAEHVICSDDPNQAFRDVHEGRVTEFKTCDRAKKVMAQHDEVIQAFGVAGTPTFLVGNELLEGFTPNARAQIEAFAKQ